MHNKLYIITGVNRGLGEAIFNKLLKNNEAIFAISRTFNSSQENLTKSNIYLLKHDLSKKITPEVLDVLKKNVKIYKEIIFINNASTITPIGKIGEFNNDDIENIIYLNTIAPIIITNHLIKYNKNLTVLNISSGAAKRPITGWSLYCATKSANEMFYETLKEYDFITIYNINPGVIDTGMQKTIRNTSSDKMPNVSLFNELYDDNKLQKAEDVAVKVLNYIK